MDKFETYSQFLEYIETQYDEDDVLTIENLMSYYINEYRGFGKRNCRDMYDDDLRSDETGELHKLALIGFEFEKKRHDDRMKKKSLKKMKI